MADLTMYLLVQWEDRLVSVIPTKDVVFPKKLVLQYIRKANSLKLGSRRSLTRQSYPKFTVSKSHIFNP